MKDKERNLEYHKCKNCDYYANRQCVWYSHKVDKDNKYKNYTKSEIIQDSFKDLRNDAIGITKGLSANNIEECNYILPPQARRK